MGQARPALDQVAECAILNGTTADLIKSRTWPADLDFGEFVRAKAELARDWNALKSLLQENTAKVIAVIRAVPNEDLGIEIYIPQEMISKSERGPTTLAQVISYPYWNMSYHEGQINYIASMLDFLP